MSTGDDDKGPSFWSEAKDWVLGALILVSIFAVAAFCSVVDPTYF